MLSFITLGYLDCFNLLAIMDRAAAVNICAQTLGWISVFNSFGEIFESGASGHMPMLFNLLRDLCKAY